MKIKDLTGQRFGRLIVLELGKKRHTKDRVRWLCKCDCGNFKEPTTSDLRTGNTQSCGCKNMERITTHGKSKTALYKVWCGIKERCNAPNSYHFHNYGGRGISICDEWNKDFQNFYKWAKSNGYKRGLTIERIDNDGNYEPSNCTWIPKGEQNNNKRDTIRIKFNGEELTLKEWSERTGIKLITLYFRICKYNWSIERALTEKVQKRPRLF